LEDSAKLNGVYSRVSSLKPIPPHAQMVIFTTAPYLADWKTLVKLGKQFKEFGLEVSIDHIAF